MNREPIGTGRLPASGGCQATISAKHIGVDLPIPEKPTLAAARWRPVWRAAPPVCSLRPKPRQHRGVVPVPLTADPAPRDCSAAAAAQRALAAKVEVVNYPDGRVAVQFNGTTLGFKVFDKIQTVEPGAIVDNKRLSAVLEQVKAQQAAYPARQPCAPNHGPAASDPTAASSGRSAASGCA
jgi:hypothetical protein